jgi:large subunit ribosomal protein L1
VGGSHPTPVRTTKHMTKKDIKKTTKVAEKKAYVKKVVTFDYDKFKSYSIGEAIELVQKFSKTKFDASLEVHFRLGIDTKKGDQQIRSAIALPFGTGKSVKVAAFVSAANEKAVKDAGADIVGGEDLIAEIKKTEKTDFQVAVAEPAMMKNLAQIAKILGTRGLMPSPKNETVTPNPALAVTELKKGKISFKNDDTGNIHVAIGKVSFSKENLIANFDSILAAIKKSKPSSSKGVYIQSATICSTMGPGVKVQV